MNQLDRLEKRIRALQARKAARAATFERVQGIDPTEHEAAVLASINLTSSIFVYLLFTTPPGHPHGLRV